MAAVVVPSAGSKVTEREILAFGREHLAAHQAPASVTFVDHLPRNSVGKLLRAQLRALASPKTRPEAMHLILEPRLELVQVKKLHGRCGMTRLGANL